MVLTSARCLATKSRKSKDVGSELRFRRRALNLVKIGMTEMKAQSQICVRRIKMNHLTLQPPQFIETELSECHVRCISCFIFEVCLFCCQRL